MTNDLVIVHDPGYAGWAFNPAHPTQGRRFINGFNAVLEGCIKHRITPTITAPQIPDSELLARVHTDRYLGEVIDEYRCAEWQGERSDLADLAQLFVGGTMTALHALLSEQTRTAVHLPGAKHHAQADTSSGFCVFADFAIAALFARDAGHRVAILDIDAHHGDGTENLVGGSDGILTFSIHQYGIFPGTGAASSPAEAVFNVPLQHGDGDAALMDGVQQFLTSTQQWQPTMLFIAAGADGLAEDPLAGLTYTTSGLASACSLVRRAYPAHPILMGGAGGYLPDDGTPAAWGAMAMSLSTAPTSNP